VDNYSGAVEGTWSLAPIWLRGIPPHSQVAQSDSSLRQCLFKMNHIMLLDRQNPVSAQS
jgi:hypothetical protein